MCKTMNVAFIMLIAAACFGGVFYPDGATTLHFAFEGSPNGDRPIIRPPAFFRADDGFGFVDSPTLVGTSRGVTAPSYFRFDVNLPPGNYDVGVTFGGTQGDSINTIKAEAHRPVLFDVYTSRAQSVTSWFTVNVRNGSDGDQSLNLDRRLNLEFVGNNPCMMKLDIQPNDKAITVYLAGDSALADHQDIPVAGWGQMLPILFKAGEVAVANHAIPNSTAQSFIGEKRLETIAKTMKAGDYLLVQFQAVEPKDRLPSAVGWKAALKIYIDEARKHQAIPVLITPVPARQFDNNGKIRNDPDDFPKWIRELAQEQKIALIDLNVSAAAFLEKLGPQASNSATTDVTHFSAYGAFELAKLVALAIQEQKLELASHLVDGIATNPDPAQFPAHLGYP